MPADRPLGIADIAVMRIPTAESTWTDHWYWCRQHSRAEHATAPAAWPNDNGLVVDCVRVGPFMSETEANIAGGLRWCVTCHGWLQILNYHDGGWCDWEHREPPDEKHEAVPYQVAPPLGMEIEV